MDLNTLSTDGIRMLKLVSTPFHIVTGGEKENVKYDKCWHLQLKRLLIVCRDTELFVPSG